MITACIRFDLANSNQLPQKAHVGDEQISYHWRICNDISLNKGMFVDPMTL